MKIVRTLVDAPNEHAIDGVSRLDSIWITRKIGHVRAYHEAHQCLEKLSSLKARPRNGRRHAYREQHHRLSTARDSVQSK